MRRAEPTAFFRAENFLCDPKSILRNSAPRHTGVGSNQWGRLLGRKVHRWCFNTAGGAWERQRVEPAVGSGILIAHIAQNQNHSAPGDDLAMAMALAWRSKILKFIPIPANLINR